MDELAFLRELEAFRSLSERALGQFLETCRRARFEPGELVLRRGDPGNTMYVILSGEVRVPVPGEDGRPKFIACLGAGEVFGEMALLTGSPRTADVIAGGEVGCVCLVIKKDDANRLMAAHPAVAAFLTEILGKRLLESDALRKVGDYRILSRLGRGGMSIVFEGYHPALRTPVAVKMLSHRLVYRSEFAQRFKAEARVLSSLKHPNIVRVHELERGYGTWFIVMELLEGTDLDDRLHRRGALHPHDVRYVLLQVARALHHAHQQGVVHRDVKPGNVFLTPSGLVKLVDFGIASGGLAGEQEDEENILCSPSYVSPEVISDEEIDGRADIYSLGVMAYEMLTGQLPFSDENPEKQLDAHLASPMPDVRELVSDVPPDLCALIDRATRKDPGERFPDAGVVVEALERGIGRHSGEPSTLNIRLTFSTKDVKRAAFVRDRILRVVDQTPQVRAEVEE